MMLDSQPDDVLPEHPGDLMNAWFMAGKKLSIENVAAKSHLPEQIIKGILEGTIDIDRNIAMHLKRVFGSSAETLFRLQAEYDHYKKYKTILSFEELPNL